MNKITVIGSGSVGSTITYALACMELASEIVMIDINGAKALGEALDIRQGTPFLGTCSVYAGNYPDAKNSDIVIITSGIARKVGQSRLDLVKTNVEIQKSIIPEITKYAPDAIYIMVSNPVDILTYTFCRLSGVPENHVMGSGTILDTARLRSRMAEYCDIDPANIHAYVFGEHGDSSFIPWSVAEIAGVPAADYQKVVYPTPAVCPEFDTAAIEKYVRESGAKVIARKGATYYAVSSAVCHICKCILRGTDTAVTVSSMMHGEYGIDDVCMSILNIVGAGGIRGKIAMKLTDEENAKLMHSASILKDTIKMLDI